MCSSASSRQYTSWQLHCNGSHCLAPTVDTLVLYNSHLRQLREHHELVAAGTTARACKGPSRQSKQGVSATVWQQALEQQYACSSQTCAEPCTPCPDPSRLPSLPSPAPWQPTCSRRALRRQIGEQFGGQDGRIPLLSAVLSHHKRLNLLHLDFVVRLPPPGALRGEGKGAAQGGWVIELLSNGQIICPQGEHCRPRAGTTGWQCTHQCAPPHHQGMHPTTPTCMYASSFFCRACSMCLHGGRAGSPREHSGERTEHSDNEMGHMRWITGGE